MEEGLVWIIPLTIIPLTSLRPCPSSVGHLHVHFGCGWPRWGIRGSALLVIMKNFAPQTNLTRSGQSCLIVPDESPDHYRHARIASERVKLSTA
jgi:hypothetical protein